MITRRSYALVLALSLLLVATLACSVGGAKKAAEEPPAPPETTATPAPAFPAEETPAEEAPPEQATPTTKPTLLPDTPTPEEITEEEPAAEPTPETEESAPEPTEAAGPASYDTVFPLPDDVQEFLTMGDDQINYQTGLSMDEIIEFYRKSFTDMGLTERPILTVIDDSGFSLVFDGWENGESVVLQGVDFGTSINVNLRFEDV
jgi:hypothetical protein